MTVAPDTLHDLLSLGFSDILDVRSPDEFNQDHLPGALSFPVLTNDERAQVGTIYKQESSFKARKLGAALVFHNAARHIETRLCDHPGGVRWFIAGAAVNALVLSPGC